MTKKIDNRREAGDMNFLVGRLGSIAPLARNTYAQIATIADRRAQECDVTDLAYYSTQLAFLTNDLHKVLTKLASDADKAKVKAIKLGMYLKFVRKLEKDANKKAPKTSADNG